VSRGGRKISGGGKGGVGCGLRSSDVAEHRFCCCGKLVRFTDSGNLGGEIGIAPGDPAGQLHEGAHRRATEQPSQRSCGRYGPDAEERNLSLLVDCDVSRFGIGNRQRDKGIDPVGLGGICPVLRTVHVDGRRADR